MDRGKLIERLMVTFLGELGDHVRAINEDLLALEKIPEGLGRGERYKTLFRAAHSLKGAARSVGVGLIEEACHHLESVLTATRDGAGTLGPDLFALLFEAADAIADAGVRLRDKQDLSASPLSALLPRLQHAALAEPGPVAPAPVPLASAPAEVARTPAPAAMPEVVRSERKDQDQALASHPETPRVTPAAKASGRGRAPVGAGFVRLPAEKLDALLAWSGELLVARQRIESHAGELETLRDFIEDWADEWRGVASPVGKLVRRKAGGGGPTGQNSRRTAEALVRARERLLVLEEKFATLAKVMADNRRHLHRAAGRLDEVVRRARMLPFAEACEGLDRAARDVARSSGKTMELVVVGGGVEIDRSVLEWLKDPLLHLVRNAVDHGLESPEARAAAGKAATGRVSVTAAQWGDQVEVVVADDGGGLDYDALRRVARERKMAEPGDEHGLTDLIFLPGLSTSSAVTSVSGRGVGLDVVKSRLEGLHATIDVESAPGQGTRFVMTVPLTLTAQRALLVRAGGQTFALASATIQRLARVDERDVRPVGGRPTLALGEEPIPVAALADALGFEDREAVPAGARKRPAVVVAVGGRRMAFLVDDLIAEQEIVIKNLGARVRRVPHVSGATILPSGRVALVLNAVSLVRSALSRGTGLTPASSAVGPSPARRRLLVVDDSVTTRTLEKSILESAGYEVLTAVDGEDGWRVLQEQGADLVVSDVDMPRMDGFALAGAIRASSQFSTLPVILISSRASDRDKARGNEVGADAYIVKGAFDQRELLETVAQLL